MGIYDVYCFVCGLPCYNQLVEIKYEEFVKEIESTKKTYKNKKYNYITEYEFNIMKSSLEYLNNNMFLTVDNKIINDCSNEDASDGFICGKSKQIYRSFPDYIEYVYTDDDIYGKFLHTFCWNYIKQKTGIKLLYSMLPMIKYTYNLKNDKKNMLLNKIDHNIVKSYWMQSFDYPRMVLDKNTYITSVDSSKNLSRINKIITQLKIKNDPKRKGPTISATFHKKDDIRIGNDGNFWIIKNNKWVKINETIIKQNIEIKNNKSNNIFVKTLSREGQYNIEKLFVSDIHILKNKIILDIITTSEQLETVVKKMMLKNS